MTKHESPKGIICERCKQVAYKENYVAIQNSEPVVDDTTGMRKIIDRYNLCKECYAEYKKVVHAFMVSKSSLDT